MGCFDGKGSSSEDGKPLDLDEIEKAKEKGQGGFTTLGNMYASLFRSRRFNDTSLQAHTEAPDPLFIPAKPAGEAFAITASRRG